MNIQLLSCPRCKKKGTLRVDPISAAIRCKDCGPVNQTALKVELEKPQVPKLRKKHLPAPNQYPPVPSGAAMVDKIEEYYIDRHEGSADRVHVGTIYCPRNEVANDPIFKASDGSHEMLAGQFAQYLQNSPHAQFVLYQYRKRIENRRRYRRDLARRNGQ